MSLKLSCDKPEYLNLPLFCVCLYVPMQNVSLASLVQAASSHVTAQVEGHVTRGLESVTIDVLQDFMEINVSRVRQAY